VKTVYSFLSYRSDILPFFWSFLRFFIQNCF